MPLVDVTVSCPVYESFRVQQVAGLFDVPLAEKSQASFHVEVPGADEPWQIGLIVGPSGSGKTTIARQAFGPWLVDTPPWPSDRAVVDGFGAMPAKEITSLLTAVGFGSPPAWVKPYHVLSGGERFRCDLARRWRMFPAKLRTRPARRGSWCSMNLPAWSIGKLRRLARRQWPRPFAPGGWLAGLWQ